MPASSNSRMVIIGASYAAGWDLRLAGYEVINKGVGGQQTQDVLARFERDVIGLKPAVVLVWGHINNIHRAPNGDFSRARERVKADYQKMIAMARAHGLRMILATEITLSEPPGLVNWLVFRANRLRGKQSYADAVNDQVRELNGWLRDRARQEGILLLDLESALDDGSGFRRAEYTSEDGSHISAAGYEALTKYASKVLAVLQAGK